MSDLPNPLVPPGVNLRGYRFMPLDVMRLRDSDLAAVASPEGFRAAILLWCAAWHQIPAGSLPDDDRALAYLARLSRDLRKWRWVREWALHGFIKCSDGRLYHPVICEKVISAVSRKYPPGTFEVSGAKSLRQKETDPAQVLVRRKRVRKRKKEKEVSPAALAYGRQRRLNQQVEQEKADQTGKYRSEMSIAERNAYDREITKLLAEGRGAPEPMEQPQRRSTHVAMTPEEREAGLSALAKGGTP